MKKSEKRIVREMNVQLILGCFMVCSSPSGTFDGEKRRTEKRGNSPHTIEKHNTSPNFEEKFSELCNVHRVKNLEANS